MQEYALWLLQLREVWEVGKLQKISIINQIL